MFPELDPLPTQQTTLQSSLESEEYEMGAQGNIESSDTGIVYIEHLSSSSKALLASLHLCENGETTLQECDTALRNRPSDEQKFYQKEKGVLRRILVDHQTDVMLSERNISHLFEANSWQRRLMGECRTRFAIKPKRLEALLFYSQHANGMLNRRSIHAGCPVLSGTKWAANLWVWNGARQGYWRRNSETGVREKPSLVSVSATFESVNVLNAKLFWEDQVTIMSY